MTKQLVNVRHFKMYFILLVIFNTNTNSKYDKKEPVMTKVPNKKQFGTLYTFGVTQIYAVNNTKYKYFEIYLYF